MAATTILLIALLRNGHLITRKVFQGREVTCTVSKTENFGLDYVIFMPR